MASPRDMAGRDLPQYCHSRLPSTSHTRVLELFPANDSSDDLRCRIHIVELAQAKATYEAISYTWGRPEFTCDLLVLDDGVDNPALSHCQVTLGRVPITPSLDQALRYFRSPFHTPHPYRRLWADAVCIDQDNPQEKAHHIPLMSSIYQHATGVLVWLGPYAGYLQVERHAALRHNAEHQELEYISRLLHHPWFRRRWVIQEVVLNETVSVFNGDVYRSFQDVCVSAYKIYKSNLDSPFLDIRVTSASVWQMSMMRSASHEKHRVSGYSGMYSICKLMRSFDRFDCADPRDRVFTLASLAWDVDIQEVDLPTFQQALDGKSNMGTLAHRVHRPQIMVIYDDEASVEKIYTVFGRSIGEAGSLPWVLGEASARLESPGSVLQAEQDPVPYWVPDWRIHSRRPSFWMHGHDVRYPLQPDWGKVIETSTGNDIDQLTFSITPSPAQSQNTKRRVFRIELPLTRITQNSDYGIKDGCRSVTPLRVTWRSETFPSSIRHWRDAASCIKRVFHEVLRLIQKHADAASSSVIRDSHESIRDQCAERFSYIVIAGGMFMGGDDEIDPASKRRLCSFAERFHNSSTSWETLSTTIYWSKRKQNMCRDIDLLYHGSSSLDVLTTTRPTDSLLVPRVAFLIKIFVLSDIDFASDENWKLLVRSIAWAMQGRCVFACDVESTPSNASPMDILGIGTTFLDLDDRIMAIPFLDHQSESNCISPLSLLNLWSRTYLVRPVPRGVDGELGKCADAPTFQFMGDCFLSTVRWLSPQRGLMPPEWFAMDDDSAEEAALKEKYRGNFSEVVEDSVIYLI